MTNPREDRFGVLYQAHQCTDNQLVIEQNIWKFATLDALRWALKHADYCTEQIEQRIAEVEGL